MLYASSVCYLCAHSRPLSPSSSSSLIVEGMEGSNAFRSTTPSPSPCSTPTLMPPLSPWRWNCTRRIAALLRPRCCGFVVCFWVNKLKMLKEQGRSLICQGQMEWKWCEKKRKVTDEQKIWFLYLTASWRLVFFLFLTSFCALLWNPSHQETIKINCSTYTHKPKPRFSVAFMIIFSS